MPTSPITKQPINSFGSATHTVTSPTTIPTPSGGYATSYGGTTTGPTTFSINTNGAIPSTALSGNYSSGDVSNTRNQYADYVQGLANAQQYSPDYIKALQAVQANKTQGATLTSNFYTGNNEPGDTVGYAQGYTTREQALNDIRGLGAQQGLDVQTLLRNGNIAAATALVNAYQPQSVSPGSSLVSPVTGQEQYSGLGGYQAVQGIQTVNNLAQTYPDAGIQPTDSLQVAQQKASQAPSFTARQTYLQQLAGGSTVSYNKLTGQYETIQGAGQASQLNAASANLKTLTDQRSQVASAIDTADKNFPLLIQAAQQAGLNDNIPVLNAFNQKIATATGKEGVAILNTLVPSLQAEYARILARGGGATTVDERQTSQALINGTYTLGQLKAVYNTVKKESGNVLAGYDSQIQQQLGILNGAASGGSSGGGIGNSGVYNF
jgi:hypothetical protein